MKKLLLITTTLAGGFLCNMQGVYAQDSSDIQEIQKQMQLMMERIDALESENARLKTQVSSVPSMVSEQIKQSDLTKPQAAPAVKGDGAVIPGTSATVKLGGYVKTDVIADVGTGYGADFSKFATIPLDESTADERSGEFTMHAKQTRLNMTVMNPTDLGDLKTFVEVDFYGSSGSELVTNGSGAQLRHAYGELGGVLAGQAWTNFMDMDVWPESLDYVGTAGLTLVRQTQVRYSSDLGMADGLGYSVSLENPNSDYTNGGANTVSDYDQMPDFTSALTQKTDWGHWSLRGLLRQISVEDTTLDTEESEIGYAVAASAKINTFDKDNLKFRFTYGDGIGRYLYDVATSSKGAAYDDGTLELQSASAGNVSYQHHWNDKWRSNIMGGFVSMDNQTDIIGDETNKKIWSAHANIIWQPVKPFQVGLEYMHGYRELDDGTEGNLDRIQASLIYALD